VQRNYHKVESRGWQVDASKPQHHLHTTRTGNTCSAFEKCWKCTEASEKLQKLVTNVKLFKTVVPAFL